MQASVPHASIIAWTPGSYGNYRGAYEENQRKPLPIWIRIKFDQNATQVFLDKFFNFVSENLKIPRTTPMTHAQGGFVITVPATTKREYFQEIIDNANHYFDPEFKTPQELALIEVERVKQKEAYDNAIAEEAACKQLEEARKNKELKEKAAAERRHLALIKHQEFICKEEERKKKLAEEQTILENTDPEECDAYYIMPIPISTPDAPRYYRSCFNERGQVAGTFNNKAAIWDETKGVKVFPLNDFNSQAISINDCGYAAVNYFIKDKPSEVQVILWNIDTNETIFGPFGYARMVNNHNKVLVYSNPNHQSFIWDTANNTIEHCIQPDIAYIDDQKGKYIKCNQHMSNSENLSINKKGSVLCNSPIGLTLCKAGVHHLITYPQSRISSETLLNNDDEVATIVDSKIVKWKANGSMSFSKPLNHIKELKNLQNSTLIAFNVKNQLLCVGNMPPKQICSFFLKPKLLK